MKKSFTEKLAAKLLSDNLVYELQGWDNAVSDGDMTKEEFTSFLAASNMFNMVENLWSDAMKEGILRSHQTDVIVEAKHLKFLGNAKITSIKAFAVDKAISQFFE